MELKSGYKQTEVGAIPEDWEVSNVGIEFDIQLGKMLDAEKNLGMPKFYLGNRAVQWGKIDTSDLSLVRLSPSDLLRFRLKKGDLLVCEGGEVGRAAIWEEPITECYYQKALHRLRPTRGFDTLLMLYLLNYWSDHGMLANYVTQTSIAHLTREKFAVVPIPLPPLPEQRAIAAALSDTDALLSSLDRLLVKKRDIKQGVMQQLLTGKQRLSGFSGKWEVKRLGDVCQIGMGRTPSRRMQTFWGKGYPWLSIADLKTKYVSETKEEITPLAASSMTVIPKGTLIMSFKLSIGRMAFTARDMYSNEAICSFGDLKMNADFLYYILGQTDFSFYGKQAVKGFTLNSESLRIIKVAYPPIEEQTAIAAVLSVMDAEIEALQRRWDKTRAVKQGMMQELLTGRTRLV